MLHSLVDSAGAWQITRRKAGVAAFIWIFVAVFLPLRSLRACLNFAQLYFECCFRGYFPGVLKGVAGYVTKYVGKRDWEEAQRKLNTNLKRGKFNMNVRNRPFSYQLRATSYKLQAYSP